MIIVAIDENNFKKASSIVDNLDSDKCMVKIGSVAFNSIGPDIIFYVAEKGFDKQYGARPLKRALQKYVEDAIAEQIIKSNIQEGDVIAMDLKKEEVALSISIKSTKSKPKEEN